LVRVIVKVNAGYWVLEAVVIVDGVIETFRLLPQAPALIALVANRSAVTEEPVP
jgi:hypothetical protein